MLTLTVITIYFVLRTRKLKRILKLNVTILSSHAQIFEPPRDKTNKVPCAPSEDSDQPGHSPSLIRVFVVRMKRAWVLSYPFSAQRRLWSDWADAQADLSLLWAHTPFCWFCHEAAHFETDLIDLQETLINLNTWYLHYVHVVTMTFKLFLVNLRKYLHDNCLFQAKTEREERMVKVALPEIKVLDMALSPLTFKK